MAVASRWLARGALLSGAALFLGVYLYASFVLPAGADVMRYSSGIYDMDVSRVVADVTTPRPALRPSVHPLQKLVLAPVGGFVNVRLFGGVDRLGAARILIAVAMTLGALGAGGLAMQLSGGSRRAGACAALISGFSFSSLLAAAIPESAVFAGLAGLAPLLYLNTRMDRRFDWGEAAVWGLLAVLCAGLTLTQIVFWVIALSVRVRGVRGQGRAAARLARVAASGALALSILAAGSLWQSARYPGTRPFYAENPLRTEAAFLRGADLIDAPVRHTARLLRQVAIDSFAAPSPGFSDFLIRDYGLDYWSISAEEAGLANRSLAQLALAAVVLFALTASALSLRSAGPRFVAPLACVAAQLALHLFYGREYVLYAPHWHGVLVATLTAAAWRGLGSRRQWLAIAAPLLALALLFNSLWVLDRTYREVAGGLDVELRDDRGELRADPGGQPRLGRPDDAEDPAKRDRS